MQLVNLTFTKDKADLGNVLAPIVLLFIAGWLDRLLDALKDYAGRSFNFQGAFLGQFGLLLLFGLLLMTFIQIALVQNKPAKGTYLLYFVLALFASLPMIFTYLIPIDAIYRIPYAMRRPFVFSPLSYMGVSVVLLFWAGLSGLLMRPKR